MDSDLAGSRLGPYQLKQRVGAGGMGTVYVARDSGLERDAAIKVLREAGPSGRRSVGTSIVEEARGHAAVSHPAIVPVYGVFEEQGIAFLAMQFMEGGTLRDRLRAGSLDPISVAAMADRIASALTAVHNKRLIHGDVKPSNILFDQAGNAYLSDFGTARAVDSADNVDARTAAYAAPERIAGGPRRPSWDTYALAVVCREALTGIDGRTDGAAAGTIGGSDPIHSVIRRALEADPGARYPSPMAFAHALASACGYSGSVTRGPGDDDTKTEQVTSRGRAFNHSARVAGALFGVASLLTWIFAWAQSWQDGLLTWVLQAAAGVIGAVPGILYAIVGMGSRVDGPGK